MAEYFECNWEEFKKRIKEFVDAVDTLNANELDNMYKALSLSYMHMNEPMWEHSSVLAFMMASEKHLKRCVELELERTN